MRQPILGICLHDHMDQSIAQRRAHLIGNRPIRDLIARRHDHDRGGQAVATHPAFLQQPVHRGLQRRRGGGQLIEKQDRGRIGIGQILGPVPDGFRGLMIEIRQAAQILRLDRGQAQIEQRRPNPVGQALHHLGLAHTGPAMQHPACDQPAGFLRVPPRRQHGQGLACRHGRRIHTHAPAPRFSKTAASRAWAETARASCAISRI